MDTSRVTRSHAQPDVTPMIDVMLVILIIFMIETPLLAPEESALEPTAANAHQHPYEPHEHTLGVDRDGAYYLDRHAVSLAELPARLAAIYDSAGNQVLYLKADKTVDYAPVLAAIGLARDKGARVVGIITVRPHGAPAP